MATQKIVAKTDTFETQRQKINEIGEDTYGVLTGTSEVSSISLGTGTVIDAEVFVDTNGAPVVVSSFDSLTYRSLKLIIEVVDDTASRDGNDVYFAEYLVVHNGTGTVAANTVNSQLLNSQVTGVNPVATVDFPTSGNDVNIRVTFTALVSDSTTKLTRIFTKF